jgi:ribosome biogenesis GTPase
MAATDHGQTVEQVVAANVDVVFLTAGLDGDFDARRLERYLTLGWESGASPVVVLTKADLCDDVEAALLEAESVAIGVPVHPVSNVTGEGVDALGRYFEDGRTVAALGSSGVGKSSLLNRLAGEELMATGDLRADGRGRHTTTNRQLLLLPAGGLYLDTPGMRELRLWESDEGLATTFDDIAAAAALCRFADCSHEREPDCGVRAALADGTLDAGRYASWRKLQNELRWLAVKQDARLRSEARKERRRFARQQRRASW